MALTNELVASFNEAKSGNLDAIDYFIKYFIKKVEDQLQNLNFSQEEKYQKINQCREAIIRNLHTCYDFNVFIEKSSNDIKNIIYLNQVINSNGSKDIVDSQRDLISAKLAVSTFDLIKMSAKDRELARLYYVEYKDIDYLSEVFKCSKTIIYFRLRKIADKILSPKMSNNVETEETFLYTK